GASTYCATGTPSSSPAFTSLTSNNPLNWTCNCIGAGCTTQTCTATKEAAAVDGTCGPAAIPYLYSNLAYIGAMCGNGNGIASPVSPYVNTLFPDPGNSTIWTCGGLNTGGRDSEHCIATRTNICIPSIVCSDSSCTDGFITTTCHDDNNCGPNIITETPCPCTPDAFDTWTCTTSPCVDGIETYTCTDSKCGQTITTTGNCTCIPNDAWTCGPYGDCVNGVQTATCTEPKCGYTETISQSCSCTPSVTCASSACVGDQITTTCTDANGCIPQSITKTSCTIPPVCIPSIACSNSPCTGGFITTTCHDTRSCGPDIITRTSCTTPPACIPSATCRNSGCVNSWLTTTCTDSANCLPLTMTQTKCTPPTIGYATNLDKSDNYCTNLTTFSWDAPGQTSYQLQISTDKTNFDDNMTFDSGPVNSGNTERRFLLKTDSMDSCRGSHSCDFINYGVPYYWRVQIWK
ncbi:MAG: hypothetical protein NTW11_01885, partial [Candidatus Staskawiczbacteria bacterium]|nr:hypothetical protein [Candidatus Staskawiczbacteria bacterium]